MSPMARTRIVLPRPPGRYPFRSAAAKNNGTTTPPTIASFLEVPVSDSLSAKVRAAKEALDKHVREIVQWHFSPETGTPFWLDKARSYKFNPLKDVQRFEDLQ